MKPVIRRTKYEIWAEILELCSGTPKSQSGILRELRLKTAMVKETLDFLSDRGLIELDHLENSKWNGYKTTNLGKQALHDFYKLIRQYFRSK